MPILFDHNPDTGVTEYFDYDPIKDQVSITMSQDITAFLDHTKMLRDNPELNRHGVKEEWFHYCKIPEVVQVALLNKGLSLTNKDHMKRILQVINSEYPYLKVTDKFHN